MHLADPVERLAAVHASSVVAKQALPRSQAEWEALADVGDLLLPGIVSAAMAFAGTKAFGLLPPTQNRTVSTLRRSPARAEHPTPGCSTLVHGAATCVR